MLLKRYFFNSHKRSIIILIFTFVEVDFISQPPIFTYYRLPAAKSGGGVLFQIFSDLSKKIVRKVASNAVISTQNIGLADTNRSQIVPSFSLIMCMTI